MKYLDQISNELSADSTATELIDLQRQSNRTWQEIEAAFDRIIQVYKQLQAQSRFAENKVLLSFFTMSNMGLKAVSTCRTTVERLQQVEQRVLRNMLVEIQEEKLLNKEKAQKEKAQKEKKVAEDKKKLIANTSMFTTPTEFDDLYGGLK